MLPGWGLHSNNYSKWKPIEIVDCMETYVGKHLTMAAPRHYLGKILNNHKIDFDFVRQWKLYIICFKHLYIIMYILDIKRFKSIKITQIVLEHFI